MNDEFDQSRFDPDDFDRDIGETLIEGSWFSDLGGAPVSWAGGNRIADLGDGTWILMQWGDDGDSVEIIPAPAGGEAAAEIIAQYFSDRYERAAALEFEEFDPERTLNPAVRERLENAISDSADESRTFSVTCVLSCLDHQTLGELKHIFRSWKGTYYETWQALNRPGNASSATLFVDLLAEQGEKTTADDILDVEASEDSLFEREYYELGGEEGADAREIADGTVAAAADPSTRIERLQDIAARTRAPKTLEALQENPAIDDAVLMYWAGSGNRRLVDFVLDSWPTPTDALMLIARSANRSQAEQLLNRFATPRTVIDSLADSEDSGVVELIVGWQVGPNESAGKIAAIARLQQALKDRLDREDGHR